MRNFSDMLRILRTDRGMTMEELAHAVGVTKAAINNYEKGTRYPKPETLEALADFFNVDLGYLTGRESRTSRSLTDEELRILNAYRSADEGIRDAVAKLLDVQRKKEDAAGSSVASGM